MSSECWRETEEAQCLFGDNLFLLSIKNYLIQSGLQRSSKEWYALYVITDTSCPQRSLPSHSSSLKQHLWEGIIFKLACLVWLIFWLQWESDSDLLILPFDGHLWAYCLWRTYSQIFALHVQCCLPIYPRKWHISYFITYIGILILPYLRKWKERNAL